MEAIGHHRYATLHKAVWSRVFGPCLDTDALGLGPQLGARLWASSLYLHVRRLDRWLAAPKWTCHHPSNRKPPPALVRLLTSTSTHYPLLNRAPCARVHGPRPQRTSPRTRERQKNAIQAPQKHRLPNQQQSLSPHGPPEPLRKPNEPKNLPQTPSQKTYPTSLYANPDGMVLVHIRSAYRC